MQTSNFRRSAVVALLKNYDTTMTYRRIGELIFVAVIVGSNKAFNIASPGHYTFKNVSKNTHFYYNYSSLFISTKIIGVLKVQICFFINICPKVAIIL